MRRLLGALPALLLVPLALAGCGAQDATTAEDESPASATPTATPTTPGSPLAPGLDHDVLAILSATAAGGETTDLAVPIETPADAESFATRFTGDLVDDVLRALRAAQRDDAVVYADVVAIGCDVPTAVDVVPTTEGVDVRAQKVPDPLLECFAPVTSVAVVAVA